MNSVAKVIKSFKTQLATIYPLSEISSIIDIVFEHELGFSKTDLLLKADDELSENEFNKLQTILERLENNEPVQYILGKTVFFDLNFNVAPGVLIPRQETEELVDWIIKNAENKPDLNVLDIGTGSGCIAIALTANLKQAKVLAFDVSEKALEIAMGNAELNKLALNFKKKDILQSQHSIKNQKFDIIVSNPPYVLEKERNLMAKNVLDYEPELALFVDDEDPLLFYKAIINYSILNLKDGGKLYFEINEVYGESTKKLMVSQGFNNVELRKDLNGKNRMIRGTKSL